MNQLTGVIDDIRQVSGLNKHFGISKNIVKVRQAGAGANVPRSYLPAEIVVIEASSNEDILPVLDESLQWYLDSGGRISQLSLTGPAIYQSSLGIFGTELNTGNNIDRPDSSRDYISVKANRERIIQYYTSKVSRDTSQLEAHRTYDILGRLSQDIGSSVDAIDHYTKSLLADSNSTAAFRNLGSAYHAIGNSQMAFASFQQALQLNPNDHIVYLKLAMFYEDYASKDWLEAGDNAIACYQHYLINVDGEDTGVLTRLGNLFIREHKSDEAIAVYDKALKLDPSLYNVWFNKAHAELKLERFDEAAYSLTRTLDLQPSMIAAKHMLTALTDDKAIQVEKTDQGYIKHLFDGYAQTYDDHGKKLLYSAPRVIRQELSKIYKAKLNGPAIISEDNIELVVSPPLKKAVMTSAGTCSDHPMEAPPLAACVDGQHVTHEHDPSECQSQQSFMANQLDILDAGCGTGLSGAWLKDYAKSLTGVDISENMVSVARKKAVYDELHVSSIEAYFEGLNRDASERSFDLVVAADVMSYIGDLSHVMKQMSKHVRVGGHIVFTAETVTNEDNKQSLPARGFKLLKNGRFGYSKHYLDSLISDVGDEEYKIVISRPFSARLDAGNPVPGFLYIAERTA